MQAHRQHSTHPLRRQHLPLAIAGVYLALALAYGVVAPPFESPDEIGHFFTTKYIADYGHLPVPEKALSEQFLYGQESTQPPLYYLAGALILRLSRIDTEDAWAYLRVNPHSTCGSPQLTGNKAYLAHDPVRERFPWQGSLLALHVLRWVSTLLGLCTVLGVWAIAGLCFPGRRELGVLAAAATALNPQFLFVSAGLNNDNLLVALCTWGLYLLLRALRRGLSVPGALLLGVVIGLAALAKLGGVLLLPLAALGILTPAWARQPSLRSRAFWLPALWRGLLVGGAASAVGGWWYVRNAVLYHDPTLIQHHLAIVSRRDPTPLAHILYEVPSIFYSYWGRFTCDLTPGAWYAAFWGLMVAVGLVGLALEWRRLECWQHRALLISGVWLVLVFVGWFRWNLLASGVQGRLLFPATATVSLVIAGGWAALGRRAQRALQPRPSGAASPTAAVAATAGLAATWLALALWVLFGLIRPTFAAPARYTGADAVALPQAMGGGFATPAGRVALLGYDVRPLDLEPGQSLEVTLYLSAGQRLTDTYSLGLWLVSAVPGDTTRLAGLDTWPGNGNYPSTVWQPGEVVQDVYRITLPSTVARAQAWTVQVNMFRAGEGGWFAFTRNGQAAGNRAMLGLVRVGASGAVEAPAEAVLPAPAVFGSVLALRGALVSSDAGGQNVRVTLWWEAVGAPPADYTVFVHLLDSAAVLRATGDGPPLQGGFPTSLWRPGDRVEDEHVVDLPLDLPPGVYRLQVGWYDPHTQARLPLDSGGDTWEVGTVSHEP